MRHRITSHKFGSRDCWQLRKRVQNNRKSLVSSINLEYSNLLQIRLSALLRSSLLSLLSTYLEYPLVDTPSYTPGADALLSDMRITPSLVSIIISKLDTHKASRCDGIPAVVRRKCAPEQAPLLSKLYDQCLAASCFSVCWKSPSVVSFLNLRI